MKKTLVLLFCFIFVLMFLGCTTTIPETEEEVIKEVIEEEPKEEVIEEVSEKEPLFEFIGKTKQEITQEFGGGGLEFPKMERDHIFYEPLLFVFIDDIVDGVAVFPGGSILGIDIIYQFRYEDEGMIIEKLGEPREKGSFGEFQYLAYYYNDDEIRVDFYLYEKPTPSPSVGIFGKIRPNY